jgi:hypothetical protein
MQVIVAPQSTSPEHGSPTFAGAPLALGAQRPLAWSHVPGSEQRPVIVFLVNGAQNWPAGH